MDVKTLKSLEKALSDLQSERRIVDEAITTIQGLLGSGGRGHAAARRGPARPGPTAEKRRKPRWSAAMRAAARARMKRYWDARRKGGAKS